MLKSTFCRAIISRRTVKQANIVWSLPRTPTQEVDNTDQAEKVLENLDDGESPSDSSFSNPLKGVFEKMMPTDIDRYAKHSDKLHKLQQKSYFKPEIVSLFDSEAGSGKGKIPQQNSDW